MEIKSRGLAHDGEFTSPNSECRIKNFKKFLSFCILNSAFLISSAFCIFSCAPKNETPPPPGLIEEKEMVLVITDLTLSEAALVGEPLSGFNDTLKRINVLKEHDLTNDRFLSSFKYYTEHPLKLKSIYNDVLKVLEEKKDSTSVKN